MPGTIVVQADCAYQKTREERPVLGPKYCRRQADICLGLSLLAEDSVVAMELIAKANEFLAKAEEAVRGDDLQARATRQLVLPATPPASVPSVSSGSEKT